MPSETSICNAALFHLGVDPITSLSATTKPARACNAIYEDTRDEVLRAHEWPFATKRQALATLSEDYVGWEYAYSMPSDCLKAQKLYDASTGDNTSKYEPAASIPYEIALSTTGNKRVLLTDQSDAILIYTAAVTSPPLFGDDFVKALAFVLASKLAMPLKQDRNLMLTYTSMFETAIARAQAIARNESNRRSRSVETILESRL